MAEMDAEARNCRQRTQISLLPLCLLWIVGSGLDLGCEVSDPDDLMGWLEQVTAERR